MLQSTQIQMIVRLGEQSWWRPFPTKAQPQSGK